MCNINIKSRGECLAQNRRNPLSYTVRTLQRVCNQKGCFTDFFVSLSRIVAVGAVIINYISNDLNRNKKFLKTILIKRPNMFYRILFQ